MADTSVSSPDLKYLGFFRLAVINAVGYVSSVYDYAKGSSGVLKPGLDRVEGSVKSVVGPVYSKVDDKPDQFLVFVDKKVDDVLTLADTYVPGWVKAKTSYTYEAVKSVPANTKAVYGEIKEKGIYDTTKGYYDKYYPTVADYVYSTWKMFLSLPFAPQLVKIVTPPALYASTKYNSVADYLKTNDTSALKTVGSYLPKVPVSDIEKTVKEDTDAALKKKKIE